MFGVPLAWLLARGTFRGRGVIQAVVDLPLVVPHTVAGIALLFLLGRTGWVGGPAGHLGISFYGTQLGIIAAMLFVSARSRSTAPASRSRPSTPGSNRPPAAWAPPRGTPSAASPCRWGYAAC